jgi:hypothetical protein
MVVFFSAARGHVDISLADKCHVDVHEKVCTGQLCQLDPVSPRLAACDVVHVDGICSAG